MVQNITSYCLVLTSRSSHHYVLFKELLFLTFDPCRSQPTNNTKLNLFCQLLFLLFLKVFSLTFFIKFFALSLEGLLIILPLPFFVYYFFVNFLLNTLFCF